MDKKERNNLINAKVQQHYKEACLMGNEVFGVFLQGSQNYNLDVYSEQYQSDVDTKVIVLPSFDDFCRGKSPVSTTVERANKEHIDLKDIRIMFETFKKQNVNFVEILFTKYFIVTDKYAKYWRKLRRIAEDLVHCHPSQTLKTMAGMSYEKYKALCHPYPTIKHKIDKYGYDGKQLHHIIRINEFMKNYIAGMPFDKCLTTHDEQMLILMTEAKLNTIPLADALKLAKELDDKNAAMKNQYIDEHGTECDATPYERLEQIKVDVLRQWFKEQLCGTL